MKPIKVIKDGKYKNVYVFKGEIIEPTKENVEMIDALNKGGFIEPLTIKETIELKRIIKEEE